MKRHFTYNIDLGMKEAIKPLAQEFAAKSANVSCQIEQLDGRCEALSSWLANINVSFQELVVDPTLLAKAVASELSGKLNKAESHCEGPIAVTVPMPSKMEASATPMTVDVDVVESMTTQVAVVSRSQEESDNSALETEVEEQANSDSHLGGAKKKIPIPSKKKSIPEKTSPDLFL